MVYPVKFHRALDNYVIARKALQEPTMAEDRYYQQWLDDRRERFVKEVKTQSVPPAEALGEIEQLEKQGLLRQDPGEDALLARMITQSRNLYRVEFSLN